MVLLPVRHAPHRTAPGRVARGPDDADDGPCVSVRSATPQPLSGGGDSLDLSCRYPSRFTSSQSASRIFHERNPYLKTSILKGRRARWEDFWALQDVSFEVLEGRRSASLATTAVESRPC